ncbi:IS3 family transposase [Pontibacter toksunensis]|uniref:IS3 family transposase n=1 Tax=Pontibacter toksunensis TaxID=1332631 RepID=A0ABW6C2D5_9BACT
MIAKAFIGQGHPLYKVLPLCGLSKSTYYYLPFCGKRGRKVSTSTLSKEGIRYSNEYVLARIEWLLNQEFVDYGYEKVTGWLNNSEGLVINGKKVYRLMKEARLLNSRIRRNRRGKRIAKDLLQNPPALRVHADRHQVHLHSWSAPQCAADNGTGCLQPWRSGLQARMEHHQAPGH